MNQPRTICGMKDIIRTRDEHPTELADGHLPPQDRILAAPDEAWLTRRLVYCTFGVIDPWQRTKCRREVTRLTFGYFLRVLEPIQVGI